MTIDLMEAKIKLLESQVEYLECKLSSVGKNSMNKIKSGGLSPAIEDIMIDILHKLKSPCIDTKCKNDMAKKKSKIFFEGEKIIITIDGNSLDVSSIVTGYSTGYGQDGIILTLQCFFEDLIDIGDLR